MQASAAHYITEDCLTLNVNQLHRDGCLEPGSVGITQWQRRGQPAACISRRMGDSQLTLSYRLPGAGAEDVEEIVPIIRVRCRYGGSRPYFVCPGVVNGVYCGRRVACLYLADRYFVCRHCNGLIYASQLENASARALRKANKLRARLGDTFGWPIEPHRPKGMWRRTFQRLRAEIGVAEARADEVPAGGWQRRTPPNAAPPLRESRRLLPGRAL